MCQANRILKAAGRLPEQAFHAAGAAVMPIDPEPRNERVRESRTLSQQAGRPSARRLAYHEAGHAVVGHIVDATMKYVTIKPALVDGAGHTFGHTQWLDLDQGPADRLVLVGLAGSLAEERAMGDADNWARSDERARIEELLATAQLLGKRDGPANITPAEEARVAAILEEHWPAVEALAKALEKKPTLKGQRVAKLVSGSPPSGRFRSHDQSRFLQRLASWLKRSNRR